MKNFIQPGSKLQFTAPVGGVISGNAYLAGALVVVACISAPAGAQYSAATSGVYELPKATGETWAEGAALYWDDTAKKFTTTATNNTRAGNAAASAISAATVGAVFLR